MDRLRGVVIENKCGLALMVQHDNPKALHYCDPPYVHGTRTAWGGGGARSGYEHEMTDEDHRKLAQCLHGLEGKVLVSGYASDLYDGELFKGWRRVERAALADGARKRTEVLWMNF